ncbi:hypothetical protein FB451DRAFT_1376525 [Mycena latifolia]|nr:hypothetical protein FB451DRAFT_1376525 [Mycena latifolia]
MTVRVRFLGWRALLSLSFPQLAYCARSGARLRSDHPQQQLSQPAPHPPGAINRINIFCSTPDLKILALARVAVPLGAFDSTQDSDAALCSISIPALHGSPSAFSPLLPAARLVRKARAPADSTPALIDLSLRNILKLSASASSSLWATDRLAPVEYPTNTALLSLTSALGRLPYDSRERPDFVGSTAPTGTMTRCGSQSPDDLKLRDFIGVAHKTRARCPIGDLLDLSMRGRMRVLDSKFHPSRGIFWVNARSGVSAEGEGMDSEQAGKGEKQAAPARQNLVREDERLCNLTRRDLAFSCAWTGRERTGGGDVLSAVGTTADARKDGGASRTGERTGGQAWDEPGAGLTLRAAECKKREKEKRRTLALHRRVLLFLLGARRARSVVSSSACRAARCACAGTSRALAPANCAYAGRRTTSTAADAEVLDDVAFDSMMRDDVGRGDGGCGDGRPRCGGLPERRAGQDAGWADASGGDGWRSPASGARGDGWAGLRHRVRHDGGFGGASTAGRRGGRIGVGGLEGLERKPLPAPFLHGCSSMSSCSGRALRFSDDTKPFASGDELGGQRPIRRKDGCKRDVSTGPRGRRKPIFSDILPLLTVTDRTRYPPINQYHECTTLSMLN